MPLEIVRNDITKMEVDAIVNAANSSLLGGGGVDGCIHRAAGPGLLEECRTLGGCRPGEAKMTKGYNLPCSHVIHTVGPVWRDGYSGERKTLASCYRTSLALAKEAGCGSVAFPLIASGIFGYPKDKALRVAVDTIGEFLMENDMTVYLVVFDPDAYQISSRLFRDITEFIDNNYIRRHRDPRRESRRRRYEEESAAFGAAFIPIEEDLVLNDFPPQRNTMYSRAPDDIPKSADTLEDFLAQLDAGFSETLLELIKRSGEKAPKVYHRANVDRRLFSRIKNDPRYQPSKTTAVAFAIALRLDLNATKDFIARAGFTLTHANKFDLIIEYFIRRGEYNIFEINAVLYDFDQPLLGL